MKQHSKYWHHNNGNAESALTIPASLLKTKQLIIKKKLNSLLNVKIWPLFIFNEN